MKINFGKRIIVLCIFFVSIFLYSCTSNNTPSQTNEESMIEETVGKPEQKTPTLEIKKTLEVTNTPEVVEISKPEKEIFKIYHIGDLTSRFASMYTPAIRGVEDWAAKINTEEDILNGEIELIFSDSGEDINLAVKAFEKFLLEQGNPLALIVYETEVAEAVISIATENHIPVLNLGNNPVQEDYMDEVYLFNFYVPNDQQFKYFLEYINLNWEKYNPVTLDTGIRLAFFAWEDDFGRSALTEENRELMKNLRIELVLEEYFMPSSVESISNPLALAWGKAANIIYTNSYFHGPALILNDLNLLGIQDLVLVAGPSAAMDIRSYSYLEYNTYFNGFVAPFPFAWYSDDDNSAIQEINENFENSSRTIADQSQQRILAQGALDLLAHSISTTISEIGTENLDAESIYLSLSSLENYQVMGGLFEVNFLNGNRNLTELHIRQVTDFLEFTSRE